MGVVKEMNEIAYLGSAQTIENDFGDVYDTVQYTEEVYCDEKSVRQSEFYQAQSVGLKPTLVLIMMACDYNGQKYVKYEDEEYTVLRTYKTGEKIELTLTRGVDHGNA